MSRPLPTHLPGPLAACRDLPLLHDWLVEEGGEDALELAGHLACVADALVRCEALADAWREALDDAWRTPVGDCWRELAAAAGVELVTAPPAELLQALVVGRSEGQARSGLEAWEPPELWEPPAAAGDDEEQPPEQAFLAEGAIALDCDVAQDPAWLAFVGYHCAEALESLLAQHWAQPDWLTAGEIYRRALDCLPEAPIPGERWHELEAELRVKRAGDPALMALLDACEDDIERWQAARYDAQRQLTPIALRILREPLIAELRAWSGTAVGTHDLGVGGMDSFSLAFAELRPSYPEIEPIVTDLLDSGQVPANELVELMLETYGASRHSELAADAWSITRRPSIIRWSLRVLDQHPELVRHLAEDLPIHGLPHIPLDTLLNLAPQHDSDGLPALLEPYRVPIA